MQTLADDVRHATRRLCMQPWIAAVAGGMLALAIGITSAFGVTVANPLIWTTTIAVVGGATLLATWRPALNAMRADPLILLRDE